jgi:hypothetical protein
LKARERRQVEENKLVLIVGDDTQVQRAGKAVFVRQRSILGGFGVNPNAFGPTAY